MKLDKYKYVRTDDLWPCTEDAVDDGEGGLAINGTILDAEFFARIKAYIDRRIDESN